MPYLSRKIGKIMVSDKNSNVIDQDFVNITSSSKEVLKNVPRSTIKLNLERNPRSETGTYTKDNPKNKSLIESMMSEGWLLGERALLHQNTMEVNGNTDLECLQGHRRITCAGFAGIDSIPSIIVTGLTEKQKYLLIVQPKRVEYGAIGEFKAVRALIANEGLGQSKIAKRLGITGNMVQDYRSLSKLPDALIKMWESQKNGGEKVPFTVTSQVIRTLYAAMRRDQGGATPDDGAKTLQGGQEVNSGLPVCYDPNGGPEYTDAFNALVMTGGAKAKPEVTAEVLDTIGQGIKDTTIRDLFLSQAGKIPNRGEHLAKAIKVSESFETLQRFIKDGTITNSGLIAFLSNSDPDVMKALAAEINSACNAFSVVSDYKENAYPGALPDSDAILEITSAQLAEVIPTETVPTETVPTETVPVETVPVETKRKRK